MASARRLIVQQWCTADGIVAEDDGGLSFVDGAPFTQCSDQAFAAQLLEFIGSVDTMVLGARTYAQTKDYWPQAEDQGEYGERLNRLAKVVASTTLDEAPWGDYPAATVTRDPVATVEQLKAQHGEDLWLWGSLTLQRTLLAADVVDEVRLLVCPATRGSGTRMFEDRRDLQLIEATGFDMGVTLLRYRLVGPAG